MSHQATTVASDNTGRCDRYWHGAGRVCVSPPLVTWTSFAGSARSSGSIRWQSAPNTCSEGGCQGIFMVLQEPLPDFESAMSHGDGAPGDRETHRTGCALANSGKECGS